MRNFFVCYNGINYSKRYIKFKYIDSEKKEINDYLLNLVC